MDEESGQPGATQDPREWMIELIGHEHDLADWQTHFRRPFDPWCERLKQGEHDFLALGSRRFDDAREPMEVQQAARILLPRLNGAMRASIGAEPVGLGVIASRVPDGPWQFSALMEAHARSRSQIVASATVAGGERGGESPTPSRVQRWAEIASRNDDLADLLTFTARADNWFDVYKAMEVAKRLHGGWDALARAVTPELRLHDVRQAANHHRHAPRGHHTLPKKPVGLPEAVRALRNIVDVTMAKTTDSHEPTGVCNITFDNGTGQQFEHITQAECIRRGGNAGGHVQWIQR